MTNEGACIEIQNLGVRYGKTTALNGVSLGVEAGEVYALLGRNGAGKSSLVRCLLGQQKPDAGQLRLLGRDSWRHRAWLMERLGVVPETPDAPPSMTVKRLASFSRRLYPRWDGEGLKKRLRRFDVPWDLPELTDLSQGLVPLRQTRFFKRLQPRTPESVLGRLFQAGQDTMLFWDPDSGEVRRLLGPSRPP